MKKRQFFKNYFIYSCKSLFDFSYFFTISFLGIIFSSIEVFLSYTHWNSNLFYFGYTRLEGVDFLQQVLCFFSVFLVILMSGMFFRFFINMLLFNAHRTVQRWLAVSLTFLYVFIALHSLFTFGEGVLAFRFEAKYLFFIVLIFSFYSIFYFVFKNKIFNSSSSFKLSLIVISLGLLVGVDWYIVNSFRSTMVQKSESIENYIIFYGPKKKEFSLVNKNLVGGPVSFQRMNWDTLSIQLEEFEKEKKIIYWNNLGDPNSYKYIKKFPLQEGKICKNDLESLKHFHLLRNFVPLTNFLPTRFGIELSPQLFCLNLGANTDQVVLYGIYSNIVNAKVGNSVSVTFVHLKESPQEAGKFIHSYQTLFSYLQSTLNKTHYILLDGN